MISVLDPNFYDFLFYFLVRGGLEDLPEQGCMWYRGQQEDVLG